MAPRPAGNRMIRPPARHSYVLLTGATGLLGRSLVRDLGAAGRRVAVVVRRGKTDAAARVDELLRDWQEVAGVHVACPVVLEGDLAAPGLGLAAEQRAWIAANVGELIHSAASLVFDRRETDGEPYTSNVDGTRRVLELCRDTGIRRLHQVSSAYVCGLRSGTVLERELDVGQQSGNDYERSKIIAEAETRAAEFLDVVTVHRPSIIVGDLGSGFTNTFHGFYRPLRIVMPFVEAFVDATLPRGSFLTFLGMEGSEAKNLVPVDWVSAVMTRIILDESLHGRTYHLTSDSPTTVGTLCRVFEQFALDLVAERRRQETGNLPSAVDEAERVALGQMFLDQMDVYRAYWRDDPVFDATNTRAAAPDLPAPALDDAAIRRLCRFAIESRFRWPPPGRRRPVPSVRPLVDAILGEAEWSPPAHGQGVGLAVTGPGGGQWTVGLDGGRPASLHVGLPADDAATVTLAADSLLGLLEGRTTLPAIRSRGGITLRGDEAAVRPVLDAFAAAAAAAPVRRRLVTA
jgi:nucleoside-diphosphate-sugar epimerase